MQRPKNSELSLEQPVLQPNEYLARTELSANERDNVLNVIWEGYLRDAVEALTQDIIPLTEQLTLLEKLKNLHDKSTMNASQEICVRQGVVSDYNLLVSFLTAWDPTQQVSSDVANAKDYTQRNTRDHLAANRIDPARAGNTFIQQSARTLIYQKIDEKISEVKQKKQAQDEAARKTAEAERLNSARLHAQEAKMAEMQRKLAEFEQRNRELEQKLQQSQMQNAQPVANATASQQAAAQSETAHRSAPILTSSHPPIMPAPLLPLPILSRDLQPPSASRGDAQPTPSLCDASAPAHTLVSVSVPVSASAPALLSAALPVAQQSLPLHGFFKPAASAVPFLPTITHLSEEFRMKAYEASLLGWKFKVVEGYRMFRSGPDTQTQIPVIAIANDQFLRVCTSEQAIINLTKCGKVLQELFPDLFLPPDNNVGIKVLINNPFFFSDETPVLFLHLKDQTHGELFRNVLAQCDMLSASNERIHNVNMNIFDSHIQPNVDENNQQGKDGCCVM